MTLRRLVHPALGLAAVVATVVFASAAPALGAPRRAPSETAPAEVKTRSGLRYVDLKLGTGPSPKAGQRVKVHYTGMLKDGKKFDSSLDRGEPFRFVIGMGQVIKGWDEGVLSMKVGGQRRLIIPPQLGYGAEGAGDVIPPNAELIFEVELLGIE